MAISQNFPEVRPTLNLNFARSKTLDPRITFERASIGTYVDENGLIKTAAADEARFDHDPATGESLGLLIEEQRTNRIPSSQNIPQTFVISGLTYTQQTISPDGTQNAYVFVPDGGGSYHYMYWYYSVVNGTTYTVSFYAKRMSEDSQTIVYSYPIFTGGQTVAFNLSTGVASQSSYSKDMKYVGNGWWRCWYTFTHTGATGSEPLHYFPGSAGTYTGDQTNGIATWGFQVEQGSFPTSYIPTSGSQVTRQSDNAQITGTNFTDFYNQNEGTWLCNFDYKGNNTSGASTLYSTALNQSNRNWLRINYTAGTPNTIRQIINSNTDDSQITISSNILNKISQAYASGDQSVYINGSVAIESTRGISTNHATLDIGNIVWDKNNQNSIITGTISKLAYYPERLTNTQLQNLTK